MCARVIKRNNAWVPLRASELIPSVFVARVQLGVVMLMINIPADAVAKRATHEHVRKKMLAGSETRDTHRGSQPVNTNLDHRPVLPVFLRHHCRHRPDARRMARRKRAATSKKLAARVIHRRPLALRHSFQSAAYDRAVKQSCGAK